MAGMRPCYGLVDIESVHQTVARPHSGRRVLDPEKRLAPAVKFASRILRDKFVEIGPLLNVRRISV